MLEKNKIILSKILFLTISTLFIPLLCFAGVNLPWSTTYDCADWNQYSDALNCDGLEKGLNVQCTTTEAWELITSSATREAGKGQRHWLGDGVNECSGGTVIKFNTGQSEIWIRWYNRFQSGFQWANYDYGVKTLYFLEDGYVNNNYIIMGYGADSYGYYAQNGDASYYNCTTAGCGFTGLWGAVSDGSWHCFELRIKSETGEGTNDGILTWWIDGVQKNSYSNINHGLASRGKSLHGVVIGSNIKSGGNGTCMYLDYDDITISNTGYIGPIGSSGKSLTLGGGSHSITIGGGSHTLSW